MTRTVAFFFKARHGFGHVRRTLLIADELQALDPSVEIVLIGQVGSLLPLRETRHAVVNLPHLHRLPNDLVQSVLRRLLDGIVAQLAPDLLVEDTFPDPNHLHLPSFREVRKVLVTRRLSGVFLDRFRQRGDLRHFDRILVAQDRAAFLASGHSPDTLLLAELSPRLRFFGPVFHRPTEPEVAAAAAAYRDGSAPLVVAAAGAGGESTTDGYGERFTSAVAAVAARRGSDARFVLITGPYYTGRTPPGAGNLSVVAFDPQLAALLHAAKVAVIRPGINSLHEALAGPARLVLVPGANTAEDQQGDAARLAAGDGIDVSKVGDVDRLDELIRHGLSAPPRQPAVPHPAQRDIAAALLAELQAADPPPDGRIFLVLGGLDTAERQAAARAALPGAVRVGVEVGRYPGAAAPVVLLDRVPEVHVTPATLREQGVRVLLAPVAGGYDDQAGTQLPDWLGSHPLPGQGLLLVRLYRLDATERGPAQVRYRLGRLRDEVPIPAIYLDLTGLPTITSLTRFLTQLRQSVSRHLCGLPEFLGVHVAQQLG